MEFNWAFKGLNGSLFTNRSYYTQENASNMILVINQLNAQILVL